MGRAKGYVMSEESKRKMSETKKALNLRHTEETKDKISNSVTKYFKKLHPLSDDIVNEYCRMSDDFMCDWVMSISENLNNSDAFLTKSKMHSKKQTEGYYYNTNRHDITPELLLIIKEQMIEMPIEKQSVASFLALGGKIQYVKSRKR